MSMKKKIAPQGKKVRKGCQQVIYPNRESIVMKLRQTQKTQTKLIFVMRLEQNSLLVDGKSTCL